MRSVLWVLVGVAAAAVFAAAGRLSQTAHVHAARLLQALRDGDAEGALAWIDVRSVAASVVAVLEEEWVRARAGDPARYVASPLARPVLHGLFGLARSEVQRRVEEELRATVRRIAQGSPEAPVQLPRWGGFPVSLAAVAWFTDVQWLAPDRVRLSAGPGDRPWVRVEMAWRAGRWVVVAADRGWVAGLLAGTVAPRPGQRASPPPHFPEPATP
ncbi:hypothetical protein HRbin32_01882 [bacterium HR32]|nr:hypothetical protein HRbin32_01882 [bacterium HR32]